MHTCKIELTLAIRHASKVSKEVILEYHEMVQDTAYNLEVHLRRIDEKITQLKPEPTEPPETSIDLEDEREVTEQCLRVCEDARAYLQSVSERASPLLHEPTKVAVHAHSYEAQLRTNQALESSRDSFAQTMGHLSKRLESLVQDTNTYNSDERLRLQSDVEISKQCLDVCSMATEVSRQKVYKIGEVIADGDSDQVVVTTLADLFDIGKALSKDKSAQLVGSMTAESLRHLTEKRYSSRFGAVVDESKPARSNDVKPSSETSAQVPEHRLPHIGKLDQVSVPGRKQSRPSSNEMRKRQPEGAIDRQDAS